MVLSYKKFKKYVNSKLLNWLQSAQILDSVNIERAHHWTQNNRKPTDIGKQ